LKVKAKPPIQLQAADTSNPSNDTPIISGVKQKAIHERSTLTSMQKLFNRLPERVQAQTIGDLGYGLITRRSILG
jgi:hypothetical protein